MPWPHRTRYRILDRISSRIEPAAVPDDGFETTDGRPRRLSVLVVVLVVLAVVVVARFSSEGIDTQLVLDPSPTEGAAPTPAPPPAFEPEPPAAGGWTAMPAAAIPARTRHTATWTGTELLVFGGQPDPGPATGARFVPGAGGTGAWRPMAPSPLGSRVGHTATWTGSELVVIEGAPVGQVAAVAAQDIDGAAYDPATNTWRPIAPAPINPRAGHVAVWMGQELLVYGGSRTFERNAPAALYDPATDTWRLTSPSLLDRAYGIATAAWTGEEVVIWMGTGDADVAAYDPVADTWRLLPGSPIQMRSVSSVWTGDSLLLLGQPIQGEQVVGGAALDVATERWTVLPPSPQQFAVTFAAAWTGTAAILVGGPAEQPGAVWTPSMGRWTPLPPILEPAISGHSATWTGESLLLWGGQGRDRPLGSGAIYRPADVITSQGVRATGTPPIGSPPR